MPAGMLCRWDSLSTRSEATCQDHTMESDQQCRSPGTQPPAQKAGFTAFFKGMSASNPHFIPPSPSLLQSCRNLSLHHTLSIISDGMVASKIHSEQNKQSTSPNTTKAQHSDLCRPTARSPTRPPQGIMPACVQASLNYQPHLQFWILNLWF